MDALRFVDANELADQLEMHRSSVYRLLKNGDIPPPFVRGLWWLDDVLRFQRGALLPGGAADRELQAIVDELQADRERAEPRYSRAHRHRLWRRVRALNAQFKKAALARLDCMEDALRGGDDGGDVATDSPKPELSA